MVDVGEMGSIGVIGLGIWAKLVMGSGELFGELFAQRREKRMRFEIGLEKGKEAEREAEGGERGLVGGRDSVVPRCSALSGAVSGCGERQRSLSCVLRCAVPVSAWQCNSSTKAPLSATDDALTSPLS
jgi:hypothetical protein